MLKLLACDFRSDAGNVCWQVKMICTTTVIFSTCTTVSMPEQLNMPELFSNVFLVLFPCIKRNEKPSDLLA
jgi:hypothetical protein